MLEEATNLIGLQVYTDEGGYVGDVSNLVLNMKTKQIDALYIERTNEALVEEGRPVAVPYRWVQAIGDIIVLRYWPGRITLDRARERSIGDLLSAAYAPQAEY